MGNTISQFQQQFHHLYKFVGAVQDKIFKQVKIYRKIKFNFDYMMVVERTLSEFTGQSQRDNVALVNKKLQMIRKYQNGFTSRLSYSIILQGGGIRCSPKQVRLYLQYFNHSLNDYLSALRSNNYNLSLEELKFVCASVVEGMTVMRSKYLIIIEMDINQYWLNGDNIWVGVDQGNVVVNPVQFIYQTAMVNNRSKCLKQVSEQYQVVDLSSSRSYVKGEFDLKDRDPLENSQLTNLCEIFVQMTRYMHPKELRQGNLLYQKIKRCKSLSETILYLNNDCSELNVEQFGEVREPQALYAQRIQ